MVAMSKQKRTRQEPEPGRHYDCAINLSASYYFKDWHSCELIDVTSIGAIIRTRQILMRNDIIVLRICHGDWTASVKMSVTFQSGPKIWLSFKENNTDDKSCFIELVNKVLYEKVKYRLKDIYKITD